MVPALVCLAAAILLVGSKPAGRRRAASKHPKQTLSPALIMGAFPLLSGGFIATGVDLATVVAIIIAGVTITWRVRRSRALRITEKQAGTVGSFLGLCTGTLRAGAPMTQAMDHALRSLPPTPGITEVLQTAARRARSGGSGQAVLIDAPVTDLQRLGTLWEASEKHGIPLVRLLEQMRMRIDARDRHRTATAAQLQGAQATAVILALLPVAGIAMGTVMGADPIGFLTGGGIGGVLLVIGVGLVAAGFAMTQKILERANPS